MQLALHLAQRPDLAWKYTNYMDAPARRRMATPVHFLLQQLLEKERVSGWASTRRTAIGRRWIRRRGLCSRALDRCAVYRQQSALGRSACKPGKEQMGCLRSAMVRFRPYGDESIRP